MNEPKNLQEVLLTIGGDLVNNAAKVQKYGGYSARNPMLGKMVRCQFCKVRRRENSPDRCCNGKFKGVINV